MAQPVPLPAPGDEEAAAAPPQRQASVRRNSSISGSRRGSHDDHAHLDPSHGSAAGAPAMVAEEEPEAVRATIERWEAPRTGRSIVRSTLLQPLLASLPPPHSTGLPRAAANTGASHQLDGARRACRTQCAPPCQVGAQPRLLGHAADPAPALQPPLRLRRPVRR